MKNKLIVFLLYFLILLLICYKPKIGQKEIKLKQNNKLDYIIIELKEIKNLLKK